MRRVHHARFFLDSYHPIKALFIRFNSLIWGLNPSSRMSVENEAPGCQARNQGRLTELAQGNARANGESAIMNSGNAIVKTVRHLLSVCILFLCAASVALAQAGRGTV